MARWLVHGCLILVLVNLIVITSNANSTITAEFPRTNEERVLKFSLRFFKNPQGRWVTQTQLRRDGFPEKGTVSRVQLSVEQSSSDITLSPHLIARLAASPPLDEDVLVVANERFMLVEHSASWSEASDICFASGQHLAVPSPALLQWLRTTLRNSPQLQYMVAIYVGISNLAPGQPFQTVLGQTVTNYTEPLVRKKKLCGVINVTEEPFKLSLEFCELNLQHVCEENNEETNIDGSPKEKNLDVGPILKDETILEEYGYDYEDYLST